MDQRLTDFLNIDRTTMGRRVVYREERTQSQPAPYCYLDGQFGWITDQCWNLHQGTLYSVTVQFDKYGTVELKTAGNRARCLWLVNNEAVEQATDTVRSMSAHDLQAELGYEAD